MDARVVAVIIALLSFAACGEAPPHGKWEATARIEVLPEKFNPSGLAFYVEKGEICALGDKWHVDKDLSYKEVSCEKGKGWIISAKGFKKLSD
jgi:hypothetical protein